MRPKLYSDLPVRFAAQLVCDVALVLWIWLWVSLAHTVHDATLGLAKPGREVHASATGLAEKLRDAGKTVGKLPYVGDKAASPFEGAGGQADKLAAAGTSQVHAVQDLAHWLGLAIAVIPIAIALAYYLPSRIRFAVRATAGRRLVDSGADLDLFALRALANQPLHRLARIDDDPARAWRASDPEVVRRLAALELADCGLKVPSLKVPGSTVPG
ncbi:hypothetical protein D9V37_13475 [Nocardioides mangrovicus]|uniref:Uncharacterized protein n=1 Tax=Nocardioides mangrovicus TaxID=2478913 RepID=A0A3L8P1N3_9ACTN|nr:hypothetical protein [Nocardioides mangrovicus]RLV48733.1 hypothetical protein D9V37_13475 [Nocardioides mangrovicus]